MEIATLISLPFYASPSIVPPLHCCAATSRRGQVALNPSALSPVLQARASLAHNHRPSVPPAGSLLSGPNTDFRPSFLSHSSPTLPTTPSEHSSLSVMRCQSRPCLPDLPRHAVRAMPNHPLGECGHHVARGTSDPSSRPLTPSPASLPLLLPCAFSGNLLPLLFPAVWAVRRGWALCFWFFGSMMLFAASVEYWWTLFDLGSCGPFCVLGPSPVPGFLCHCYARNCYWFEPLCFVRLDLDQWLLCCCDSPCLLVYWFMWFCYALVHWYQSVPVMRGDAL
jgi:hypothetical protein